TDREIDGEALQIVEKAISNITMMKEVSRFCKTHVDFNEWNPPCCELLKKELRLHTLLLLAGAKHICQQRIF
ncbi:MAG: hypothetical protein J6W46_02345, partial [Spirochaetaceae bacterium]|nr:hypothetical protein [Spirochaetaceae bacterium]